MQPSTNEERLERAADVVLAIRAISDLLLNMQLTAQLGMVLPQNLEALLTIIADRLEQDVIV